MAPAADYLFLSMQTLINTISLFIMVSCTLTLLRTQCMHANCKVLLVTSAIVQLLILFDQTALFAENFIIDQPLQPPEKQGPFEMMQNGLFAMSGFLSLEIVLERTFAVFNAAKYETSSRHIITLLILISVSFGMGLLLIYTVYWLGWGIQSIIISYSIEGLTILVSMLLIVYAHRKYRVIPYGENRLKAKYQVKEVLDFSLAILPSIIISAIMHTLSLVPNILWINGMITYPVVCLIYYSVHSLNCVLTKLALIACHKNMRARFQLLFVARLSTPKGARMKRDVNKEGEQYFAQMRAAWQSAPKESN